MKRRLPPWLNTRLVIACALALALGFVMLAWLQPGLFGAAPAQEPLQRSGPGDDSRGDPQRGHMADSTEATDATPARLASLPAGHRQAVFSLGFAFGAASELTGSTVMATPAQRDAAAKLADAMLRGAARGVAKYGLGGLQPLQSADTHAYAELAARYEADEGGIGARIEQQLSPLHRHLFLLGVHLGSEAARIENTQVGQAPPPPAALIERHATLAGIEPSLWQPLAAAPAAGESPTRRQERYRLAVAALGTGIARQEEGRSR